MITFEQLEEFEYEMRDRISRVLKSNKKSLADLQADFFNYNKYVDVSYSTEGNVMYIIYSYFEPAEGIQYEEVEVPRLFVDDFEEFMRQA